MRHNLKMMLPCLLLGFFVCPTDQAPSPYMNEENHIWNCTLDKIVKGDEGERLTIVSRVNPVDRCYFEFTHQDDDYRCCYQNKEDNYCGALQYKNGPKCLKSDNYLVKIDSKGHSAVDTCNLTITSVSPLSEGKYQSFHSSGQPIQMCNISITTDLQSIFPGFHSSLFAIVFSCFIVLCIWYMYVCFIWYMYVCFIQFLMTRFKNKVRSYCKSRTKFKVVKWGSKK